MEQKKIIYHGSEKINLYIIQIMDEEMREDDPRLR